MRALYCGFGMLASMADPWAASMRPRHQTDNPTHQPAPSRSRAFPANRRDSKLLEDVVDAVPAIRQCVGRPRGRADIFTAVHQIAASLIRWRFVQKWFCSECGSEPV
ncbi:hypothetical protein SAMN02982994_3260 [Azospirillum lipoferum]|nr:hypothetical protein SAMN02982994_3260 [Azospirillum lipoferum]